MWSMTSSAAITAGNDANESASSSRPFDLLVVGELGRDAGRVRGRRGAAQLLGVQRAREAVRDLRGDPFEELVRRAEVGVHRAGDEHADRQTAGDERVAPATRSAVRRRERRSCEARAGNRRGDALHRIHLRDDVDRELQVRRRVEPRRVDLRQLEQARRFEQLDEQPAVRVRVLQPVLAAGLDRVEPGQRLVALRGHGSTPRTSASCSSWSSTSCSITSRSSGRNRIARSKRSRSGGLG